MSTCCFSGHRNLPPDSESAIVRELDRVVSAAYSHGYTDFWAGGALGFDTLAAEAVLRLRASHPAVQLRLALPCPQQADSWPRAARRRYDDIRLAADEVYYASDSWNSYCMSARNRYMADRSDLVICFFTGEAGGTANTVKYALSLGRRVVNIAAQIDI